MRGVNKSKSRPRMTIAPWPKRLLLVGMSMIVLQACVMTPETETRVRPPALCQIFIPISFSADKDSEVTIKEIRRHNAAWDSLCLYNK